mgnify:CR=1 FL=1
MANSLHEPMTMSVEGLKAAQDELGRLTLAVATKSGGGLRNTLLLALLQMQRYALGIVHVKTGRLKNSIFTDLETAGNDLLGHVATNVEYAFFEESRGRDHAYFARTVKGEGPHVVENSIFAPVVRGGR